MYFKKKPQKYQLALVICFILAGVLGWWWQDFARKGKYRDLAPAFYLMGVLKLNFYQPVDLTKLMREYWRTGNIAGMMKSLNDPYTRFLNKNEYGELTKETQGSFGGIGVYLIPKEEELLISSVVKNSPGEQVGLQQGDRIVKVDAISVKDFSPEVAVARIRGAAGTKVSLRVVRGEGAKRREIDFQVTRANVFIPTVEMTVKKDPTIGEYAYIRVSQFAETTADDLDKNLKQIDNSNQIKGTMLDLRANPGGSLDAAIRLASQFIPKETPVLHIKRRGYPVKSIFSYGNQHKQLPMVVLVDNWSASASEILAGALKDQKRAQLIGNHTFGKDLIQEVKKLPGGTGATITIASYLTSGKVNIHKRGVQPDYVVEIPGAMDLLLKEGKPESFLKMQKLQEEEAVRVLRNLVIGSKLKKAG
ncbi:MAG: S41 family peptidase [Firmicutes bacterium]|nr:S41 family peptidase [Bacillota bacterium]